MITATYGFGVALAAFAGVLAAPIYQVRPGMGADIIAVVFAVVVIGAWVRSWLDPHRLRARRDRGPHKSVLPRDLQHGGVRHHGDRADHPAFRPVRTRSMSAVAAAAPERASTAPGISSLPALCCSR